jgi:inorganic triphosphatase YgiF
MRDDEPREIEYKLRTSQPLEVASVDACLREAPPTCVALDSELHHDVYVDTGDGALRARGAGLRLRTTSAPAAHELTFKGKVRRDGARHERVERTAAWPSAEPPTHVDELPGELYSAVLALVGHTSLQPVLTLLVDRERRSLRSGDVEACEVAIDRIEVLRHGRRATFAEVEIEVRCDDEVARSISARLQRDLGLEPAPDDKPSHALALLGLAARALDEAAAPLDAAGPDGLAGSAEQDGAAEPPGPDAEPPAPESAADPVATAVAAQCAAWQAALAGFGDEPPPAEVHAYRVALRHLRTLLRDCPERWPGDLAADLGAQLAERANAAAATRAFDVLLGQLEAALAAAPTALADGATTLFAHFRQRRAAAAVELAASHLDPAPLLAALRASLPPAAAPAEPWAQRLLDAVQRLRKRLRRAIAEGDLDSEHRARLAAKRLRQLAAMIPAIAAELGSRRLRRLARLQQHLGDRRDSAAAIAALTERLAAAPPPPGQEAAAIGAALVGLGGREAAAADASRRLLQKLVRRRIWRDLLPD